MKKLLIFSLLFFAALGVKAQTYLANGDYVTISSVVPNYYDQTQGKTIDLRVYLEATTGGISTQRSVTDGCLWKLITNANGYALQNVSTGKYLGVSTRDNNNFTLVLNQSQTLFRIDATTGRNGEWLQGNLYYQYLLNHGSWTETVKAMVGREHSEPYTFIASRYNAYMTLEIEKWEQVGGGDAAANFEPADKVIFEYAANDDAAQEQAIDVKFMLQSSSESYYKCVCREEMLLNRQTTGLDITKVTDVKVSWLHGDPTDNKQSVLNLSSYTAFADGETDRTLMTLSEINKLGDNWQFKITPIGKSPMGLKAQLLKETVNGVEVYTEEYVDFVDWAVVSYKYNGKDFTQQLRVVRKAYHEDKLPTLVLTVNPVNWTFGKEEEVKVFDVEAIHQHGSVIYSVENIAIGDPVYETGYEPKEVTLTSTNLTLTLSDTWKNNGVDELTAVLEGGNIKVSAKENETGIKRSAVLTGTLCPIKEQDHPCQTFTIDLHQRYVNAGIQLIPSIGKGNTALQENQFGRKEQAVHTAERTIYYDEKEAIELRLPESGYSGYMRWYDYETNGAPNYNHCHDGKTPTAWDFAPQSASGKAFAAINTPVDKNSADNVDGYSLGLYALHKGARGSDGNLLTAAILDEEQNDNPAPRIRPWSDNGYHIMACDVSAYTDYEVVVANKQIQSITEPTLSYRQLFHMYPASVMADTLAARNARGEYLENYSYQAPAGKQVLLATEYRFHKIRSHISEMCYFYYDKTGKIQRITDKTTVVWKEYILQGDGTYRYVKDITPQYSTLDYLVVQENSYPVQKKYTLTVPAANANTTKDLLIASFEVKYQDVEKYGPTDKIIITQQRIEADYDVLATINFDEYDSHLPWDYTSYGYVYNVEPLNTDAGFKRGASQGIFPFYGEYTVVENVDKDWARSDAHSGKALYVDGTMEPGLVATIAAPTNICSGQTVYCSAWLRNPRPQSDWAAGGQTANPIFRCNIQGRTKTDELDDKGQPIYTEWEDAGVYFVGELAIGSKWQQIVFPIESAHSYDETRVSIYNFATTNQGNDFMVDDINLYVSRLPIAAYQGKMTCRSSDSETTRAAAVLRLDYTNINVGDARYMYYQIFNSTMKQPVELVGDVAYYHEAPGEHDHSDFGSVGIPDVTFDPEVYNEEQEEAGKDTVRIYYSVSKLLDDMVAANELHAKAYVKTENSGVTKWLLYVAHLLDQVTDQSDGWNDETKNTLPLQMLFDQHTYVMRMAYTPEELPTAECNLTTPIHATQQTVFTLRNSDKKTIMHTQTGDILTANTGAPNNEDVPYIFKQSYGNCANDLYFLTSTVVNHLAVEGAGTVANNIAAPIYSDWLIGDPDGDVLSETPPPTNDPDYNDYLDRMQTSIAGFEKKYGYTHGQVSHAIMYDMRRVPTEDEPNPNYAAKTFKELDPSAFESLQNYEIVRSLYENGWLQLYDTTVHFYLGSQDTARYWCFPIAETAKTTIKVGGKDSVITIKDCNEPHRVMVTSVESNYQLNVAPILKKDKTPQQKLQLPNVNVLANSNHTITSVTIPIKEIAEKVEINSGKLSNGDNIIIDLTELPAYISFFDLDLGKAIAKPTSFEIGEKYTMRLAYQKEGGYLWMGTENASCRVGYIFFTIQVVPNTMVWTPEGASFNGWGKNENWRGWKDEDGDFVIDEGELTTGFVPMAGSNVVIPNLGNEILYPYIVPEHEHDHYPMTIHHDQHRCENIYFAPGAMIQNQHLLHYEKAFVDMPVIKGGWHMMSAPLQSMYSGDMFIPHNGGKSVESTNPFVVSKFEGQRSGSSTYAFWGSYYNQTINTYYSDGSVIESKAGAAVFLPSNSMEQELKPASGFLLWGNGPENELVVRLPKPNDSYENSIGNTIAVPRNEKSHFFAFTANHDDPKMDITLTNEVQSKYFVFGNPTMAYINMVQFLKDHDGVLEQKFYRITNNQWSASVKATMESNEKYLAPMTSVMLEAKEDATTLSLVLSAEHLTLNDQVAAQLPERHLPRYTTARHTTNNAASESQILTIYAIAPDAHARAVLATHPDAYDYYQKGEDAVLMSSGIENDSYAMMPMNLYTIAEQVPMMVDVRQGISRIPLSLIVHKDYKSKYMQLAFYLSKSWTHECYIVDSYTGQKIRIMDGLIIKVEMPNSHQERYFIEGPDEYLGSGNANGNGTTTAIDNTTSSSPQLYAYSMNRGELVVSATQPIRDLKVYSIAGQLLSYPISSADYQLSTINCQLPSGVCVVEATLHNGVVVHQQAIVK